MSKAPSRRGRRLLLLIVIPILLFVFARWLVLPGLGQFLVHAEEPVKAEVAVVLAGDQWGNRVIRGAELKRDGFVGKVLVSGGPGTYGFYESELAVRFAVKKGFPEDYFEALHEEVHSTQEEAHSIAAELKRRGIKTALIVTSDYHSMRARRIWRHTAPWLDQRMIAAPDRFFRSGTWWYDRESGKNVFTEWAKILAFTFDFFPPEKSGPVKQP
jgi:uncharacterized SAM-binding protein YcdF (DUF218 family)